jgi:hypothetical protein
LHQDVDKGKLNWTCSHAGVRKMGSKKYSYSCGHSVITCPKCDKNNKEGCPLPGCSPKNATSAMPTKKKSMTSTQKQGHDQLSSSDNLFYLILPPEVVLTVCMGNVECYLDAMYILSSLTHIHISNK